MAHVGGPPVPPAETGGDADIEPRTHGHVTAGLPPLLYKYMPLEGGISLLRKQAFWFRCPLQFPDVQDSRANLLKCVDAAAIRMEFLRALTRFLCDPSAPPRPVTPTGMLYHKLRESGTRWTPEHVEREFGSTMDNILADLEADRAHVDRAIAAILADVRVLCLCQNGDSPEMWMEYADGGHGMCIGFRYVPEIDNALGGAQRVQYVDKWPVLATPREWARHWLGIETIPFSTRAGDALYLKATSYSHEQEWRVVTKPRVGTRFDRDGIFRVHIDPREVGEVVLGARVSAADAFLVKSMCDEKYSSVRVSRAT